MKSTKRHILVHYHIFKNAGTTVSFILKRNFGRQLAFLDARHSNAVLDNAEIVEFLEKHPGVRAISSHNLRPPKPQYEQFTFHDILFLRNPLARLASMYDFYRRNERTKDPLSNEANRRSAADFMKFLIQEYPSHVGNAQVSYLADRNRVNGESQLKAAFRIASQATVLGVTELFDIGAVLAEYSLAPYFSGLNFAYIARNVSSIAPRVLRDHLPQLRDAWGDDIYEQLVKLNSLDLALLELACKDVYARFRLLPDHEERLRNFCTWRNAIDAGSTAMIIASNHPHDFVHYANLGIT